MKVGIEMQMEEPELSKYCELVEVVEERRWS